MRVRALRRLRACPERSRMGQSPLPDKRNRLPDYPTSNAELKAAIELGIPATLDR